MCSTSPRTPSAILLPTAYCLLPTTYYLLPTTYYLLPTYLLPTTYLLQVRHPPVQIRSAEVARDPTRHTSGAHREHAGGHGTGLGAFHVLVAAGRRTQAALRTRRPAAEYSRVQGTRRPAAKRGLRQAGEDVCTGQVGVTPQTSGGLNLESELKPQCRPSA